MDTSISLNELKSLFVLAIRKLDADNFKSMSFNIDYYWEVSSDDAKNMSIEPTLAVGSLADDISGLKKALKEHEMVSYSEFDRLASVLKFMSEMLAPIGKNDAD